jgi:hypothetical protein
MNSVEHMITRYAWFSVHYLIQYKTQLHAGARPGSKLNLHVRRDELVFELYCQIEERVK